MNAYRLLHRVGFRAALRRCYRIDVVGAGRMPEEGGAVVVSNHASIWNPFPERQNGWHSGAARLALAIGAPVVPVSLTGTRPLPRPTRIRIVVGEPVLVEPTRPTIAAARSLTAWLEEAVTAWPG